MDEKVKYIPPLVSGSRLPEYNDVKRTLNEKDIKIGGYIRISTRKDAQKTSIDNQKKLLSEWANINGYNLVDFYMDVKSGAYAYSRNDMQRMKKDVKLGRIKGIVAKEISRTSRDVMDILELKRTLDDYGAFFISIKEAYDSRTDDDEFLLVLHAGLAQKERKTTSSRVKLTQMIKAKEGKTNVASPAYGYKLSEDRQHLVIDEEKAEIYRFIVDKFLEGWGHLKICKYLNRNNIPAKRGGKWHTNSIRTILTNPVYLGITIYNATTLVRDSNGRQRRVVRPVEEWIIREGTHEPLISKEKFDKIQDIIRKRKEKDKKAWSCTKKYLLSGLLYCSVCKGKIYGSRVPSQAKRPKEEFLYYYVDQNLSGTCDTKSKYWKMKKVDKLVLEEIKKFFGNQELIAERIKQKQYLYNRGMDDEKAERERLSLKIDSINRAIRKQQKAYEEDVITLEEYKNRMLELRAERENIIERINYLNQKLQKIDSIEERYIEIKDKVNELIENFEMLDSDTKDTLLRKIVRKIFLNEDYTFKIEYTFEE